MAPPLSRRSQDGARIGRVVSTFLHCNIIALYQSFLYISICLCTWEHVVVSSTCIPSLMLISERFAEIRLHFLFGCFSAEFEWLYRTNGCEDQNCMKSFVRLGLKIISSDFEEEDLTKIVGGVSFQRFLIKPEI